MTPPLTPNPYAPIKADPVLHTGGTPMPATVSTVTGGSVIAARQAQTEQHNALVQQQSGKKVVGGSKCKRSKCKSNKCKCNKCKSNKCKSNKCKRSHKRSHKRSYKRSHKRGGAPALALKPMTVPQFAGAHNAGANANSLASNRVLTDAVAQAAYDNTNARASNTKVV